MIGGSAGRGRRRLQGDRWLRVARGVFLSGWGGLGDGPRPEQRQSASLTDGRTAGGGASHVGACGISSTSSADSRRMKGYDHSMIAAVHRALSSSIVSE
jgi:hypothetical protein